MKKWPADLSFQFHRSDCRLYTLDSEIRGNGHYAHLTEVDATNIWDKISKELARLTIFFLANS